MNSHLRDARTTPAQRAAEAALQAFTKEHKAENAYRHFQKKYKKRKDKGWRNMGPMREEEHELKEALAAVVKKGAKRKAPSAEKAQGKRRAVLKKKAGKETPAHTKLAKKRSSKKK